MAAVSSCHVLMFLYLASRDGVRVLRYEDDAVGRMTPNERGTLWVSAVEPSPRVAYGEDAAPSAEHEADLRHRAHEQCYIANSVRTAITVRGIGAEPRRRAARLTARARPTSGCGVITPATA